MRTGLRFQHALAVAALALACFGSTIPTAEASYPGRNGRIAYVGVYLTQPGVWSSWTETILPNGHGRRRLTDVAGGYLAASGLLAGTTPEGLALMDDQGRVVRSLPRPIGPDGFPLGFAGLSPDGRLAAFIEQVSRPHAQPEQIVNWIWTMRIDGTQLRRLGPGARPRWTPDSRRIVFERYDAFGSYHGIASMRADGSRKRLLDSLSDARLLDLAPDGRRLLWWGLQRRGSNRRNWRVGLFTSDLRGHEAHLISRGNPGGSAAWSPDGTKIVFAADDVGGRAGTFITSATGGEQRRLLRHPQEGLTWQPRRG